MNSLSASIADISSPLITYQPSRSAWTPGVNGTTMYTFANQSAVFNFTGTSLHFNVEYASVNQTGGGSGPGGSSSGNLFWHTRLVINGTEIGNDASALSADDLPNGKHYVELQFSRLDGNATRDSYAMLRGVKGSLAQEPGPAAWNLTLDDSVRNSSVVLTEGWNRLSADTDRHPENISNETLAAAEEPQLAQSWEGTLAVAEHAGSSAQLSFTGSAVWVYGPSGGPFGEYMVQLDGRDVGHYGAQGGNTQYQTLLYHASGLREGAHRLKLVSVNGRIGFDRLISSNGLVALSAPKQAYGTLTVPTTTVGATTHGFVPMKNTATATAAASKGNSNTTTAIAASVGTIGGLIVLTLLGFLIWTCCVRKRRRENRSNRPAQYLPEEPGRWYLRRKSRGWKFEQLEPGVSGVSEWKTPSTSSFGSSFREPRSPPKARAKSLFSSKTLRHQPAEYDMQPVNTGAGPMAAALGGASSPLSQLQSKWRKPHYNKASEISAPLPLGTNYAAHAADTRGHGRTNSQASNGSLGSDIRNWYEWFGGVYAGSGGASTHTRRNEVGIAS